MFQPSYFKQKDIKQMLNFIQEHCLATLVSLSSQGLIGNHIPMLVIERAGKYFLQGHVARVNSIWKDRDETTDMLAIFQGPEAYISPNWYPGKKIDHKAVPTWNYMAVHVTGEFCHFEDKKWLREHLISLIDFNEKSQENPWKLTDAPDDYINSMLGAIVGIEIKINDLKGQSKMSQNHPEENRQGVIQGLRYQGKIEVANKVAKPEM